MLEQNFSTSQLLCKLNISRPYILRPDFIPKRFVCSLKFSPINGCEQLKRNFSLSVILKGLALFYSTLIFVVSVGCNIGGIYNIFITIEFCQCSITEGKATQGEIK